MNNKEVTINPRVWNIQTTDELQSGERLGAARCSTIPIPCHRCGVNPIWKPLKYRKLNWNGVLQHICADNQWDHLLHGRDEEVIEDWNNQNKPK